MGRHERRKSLIVAEMNVLPLQFHHAGVTSGLRSGKEMIINASIVLRLLNHILLKNKRTDTQEQLTHSSKLPELKDKRDVEGC